MGGHGRAFGRRVFVSGAIMAIQVLCGSCKATFTVSDRYAGQTGPCPKCKQPITIPATPVKAVVIHEPEAPSTTSTATGRAPTSAVEADRPACLGPPVDPRRRRHGARGRVRRGGPRSMGQRPTGLVPPGRCGDPRDPLCKAGIRGDPRPRAQPYRGRSLLLRTLICAAVYVALWVARGYLPAEIEMWEWLYYAPVFIAVGAFAAFACFDFDSGSAIAHFSLFLMVSAALRWLAGITHL